MTSRSTQYMLSKKWRTLMPPIMPAIIPPDSDPSSFDAAYAVFLDHASRTVIVTNIAGEPTIGAELVGTYEYWIALATAWPWEHEKGYTLECREWKPGKHDPDQLRGYEVLPFSDESAVTS